MKSNNLFHFQKYRVEIGARAFTVFLDVLHKERSNLDLLSIALEALFNVIAGDCESIIAKKFLNLVDFLFHLM